jgi:hypothetical protein
MQTDKCVVPAAAHVSTALGQDSAVRKAEQQMYWFSVNWKRLGWQLMSGCCFGCV